MERRGGPRVRERRKQGGGRERQGKRGGVTSGRGTGRGGWGRLRAECEQDGAEPGRGVTGEVREGGTKAETDTRTKEPLQAPPTPSPPWPQPRCLCPEEPWQETPLSKPHPRPGNEKCFGAKLFGKQRLFNHMNNHSLSYLFPASGFPPLANHMDRSSGAGRGRGASPKG